MRHNIITNGLLVYTDAAFPISYPGTGTSWYDLSGNNKNATLYNSPEFITGSNNHFIFDGSINTYVQFPSLITPNITIDMWVKPNCVHLVLPYVTSGLFGVDGNYRVMVTTDTSGSLYGFAIKTTQNSWYSEGTSIGTGYYSSTAYNNIVATYDGIRPRMYIDGLLQSVGTIDLSGNMYSGSPLLSFKNGYNVGYYKGNVASIRIYNRGLSLSEIQQNYYETVSHFKNIKPLRIGNTVMNMFNEKFL